MTCTFLLVSLSLLSCLLSIVRPCGAQTDFALRNKEGLSRNPAELKLFLRTEDGSATFHLFETIPIALEFTSTRPSAYSIELDEMMNFAGQASTFEVSPADSAFLPYPANGSPSAVCCSSDKRYLSLRPITLRRELTNYLRFERAGTYSVFLVTNRVFRGLGRRDDFDPSKLTLTSNILTLTILPDDPKWDSQKLTEALRELNDPRARANYYAALRRAKRLERETEEDFARSNRVSQTEYVKAQEALNALDTEEAIRERVNLMQMESKSELEMSRTGDSATLLPQPLLASTTRADLIVEAMKKRAEQPDFGVDFAYVQWWVKYLVQREHPELFRPLADEAEREKRIRQYSGFCFQAERALIGDLDALLATKTGNSADVTAVTIRVLKSFQSHHQ